MKTIKTLLEQKRNTIVLGWGRMNPPTNGHELLVKAVLKVAQKYSADHVIYLTRTQDPKKNPLTVDQKVFYARKAFPGVNIMGATDQIRTFIEAVKALTGKYENLIMVAGSDRVLEYKQILDKYNGKDFNFKTILVVSAGERDPDSDTASGMSATKMRQAAAENNFNKFKMGVPSGLSQQLAKRMFDDVRAGMGINETFDETREKYINEEIFNIGDVVIHGGKELAIIHRGSNYVILEDKSRAWLKDIKPTTKVNEAIMVNQQEKLKAARIIAMALGYEDAADKTDPTLIVNTALRSIKNKPLTKEAKSILLRMLELAKKLEIKFDENIITEDTARADYKITKSGRKYRPIIKDQDSKGKSPHIKPVGGESVTESEEEEIASHPHNLMHKPDIQQSEYKRQRKIHLKMHESEDEDEEDVFDEDEIENLLKNITDDDIIEHGYEDDEFHVVDDETNEIVEESTEEDKIGVLNEVLSRVERMRAKVRMMRSKAKRERSLRIALKKRSNGQVLSKRARRVAVKMIERKLARKPLNQLSVAEKERIEAKIQRMKPIINRIAIKMLPRIRQVEKERLEHKTTAKE